MAILDINGDPLEEAQVIGQIPTPTLGDSASAAVQQAGLSVLGQVGGGARIIGDMFNSPTTAQWGRDLNLNAKQAAEELTPLGEGSVQSVFREAAMNTAVSLPALLSGGIIPALTIMGGQSYLDGYSKGRDGGLSVGRSHVFAGVDAIFETATEAWSLPVLFRTGQPLIKAAQEFLMKELVGEETTTIGQTMNELLSLKPDMTVKEYWDNLKQAMIQTAIVTPPTALMQFGVGRGINFLRKSSSGANISIPGETPPPATSTYPGAVVPPNAPPVAGAQSPPKDEGLGLPLTLPQETPVSPLAEAPGPMPQSEVSDAELQQRLAAAATLPRADVVNPQVLEPVVEVPLEIAQNVDTLVTPQLGGQVAADVAVLASVTETGDVGTSPEVITYANQTPEEIVASEQPDLRLYQGTVIDRSLVYVGQSADGKWYVDAGLFNSTQNDLGALGSGVTSEAKGAILSFETYAGAKEYLESKTGEKLSDPAFVQRQHLNLTVRDAVSVEPGNLTPTQLKFYGEPLARIADKAKIVQQNFNKGFAEQPTSRTIQGPGAPLRGLDLNAQQNLKGDVPFDTPIRYARTLDGEVHLLETATPEQHAALAGRVLKDSGSVGEGVSEKVVRMVEAWAKRYKVSLPIILYTSNMKLGGASLLQTPAGVYLKIGVNNKITNQSQLLAILSHEFGHVLFYDTILKADRSVTLSLVEAWLDSYTDTSVNASNANIIQQEGVMGVSSLLNPKDEVVSKILNDTVFDKMAERFTYNLQLHEFAANQIATHIYENKGWAGRSETYKPLLEQIAARLELFFKEVGRKFMPNTSFKQWLNDLAGVKEGKRAVKVDAPTVVKPKKTSTKKTTKAGATVTTKTAEAPAKNLDPVKVKERAKIIQLFKQYDLWNKEMQDELDPQNSSNGFDFKKSYDYLDALGVSFEVDIGDLASRPIDEPDTYNIRASVSGLVNQVKMPLTMRQKVAESSFSVRNFGRFWRSTLTALQVRKIYGDKIPGVKDFVDSLQKMAGQANKIRKKAEDTVEIMRKVGEESRTQVFDHMIEEDAQGRFLNTPADFQKTKFQQKEIDLYNQLRTDFRDALQTIKDLAVNDLINSYNIEPGKSLSPEKQVKFQTEKNKLEASFAEMLAKPYYPHTRFGDYYAAARTEDGTVLFAQYETMEEAKKLADATSEKGTVAWYGQMPENVKPLMGLPYEVFNMMKNRLDLTEAQVQEFDDILLNLSSGQSFIRKFKHRKNIAGWEADAAFGPRVYVDYFTKYANYSARMMYSPLLNSAISDTTAFKKEFYSDSGYAGNVVMIDRLVNWMKETKEYALRPDVSAANLRAAVTLWYLGAVPKSAAVNAFSVPLMTLPWLGKRYGDMRTMAALKQAYTDVGKHMFRYEAFTPEERNFVNWLEEVGVADQSYASTMAGIREGGRLMESFDLDPKQVMTAEGRRAITRSTGYNIKYWAMLPFHKVEVMNRLVSGIAAYRLAKTSGPMENGFDQAAAEIAKDCVQDTQNENQQWNRPELMRGKKSLLTLFMSYTQNAMFQMYGGDQSWQRMLALQLMIAGLLGIPLAKNADDVIRWFAKRVFGSDVSVDLAVRKYLEDSIIRPEWILHGASFNMLGTNMNLSGSMSMGNIIPGIDALVMEGTFPERLANAAADVGGAGASVIMNFMKAAASDNPDSFKRWSQAMPTQAKNVFEGYRMVTQGTIADGAGDPILNVSGYEGAAKFLGFQSTNVSREREKRFMQHQMAQYWLTRRKMIFDLYEFAEQSGDIAVENRAEEAMDTFNDEVPDSAMSIRRRDISNSLKARQRNALAKEEGIAPKKSERGLYEEVGRRY